MARVKLPENATVRDVLTTLSKPEDYVRGIVGTMTVYQRKHGPAIVRIGMTGRGKQPNYRLEPLVDKDSPIGSVELEAFNGSSHKPAWDNWDIRGEHWSSGSLTFAEVQLVLGELRNWKGPSASR